MTRTQFEPIWNRLFIHYGTPEGGASKVKADFYRLNETRNAELLAQAVETLIQTRQYSSFPKPGEITAIYTQLAHEVSPYEEPEDGPNARAFAQLRAIDDAIYRLPPNEKQRLRDLASAGLLAEQEAALERIKKEHGPGAFSKPDPWAHTKGKSTGFQAPLLSIGDLLSTNNNLLMLKTKHLMRVIYCQESGMKMPYTLPLNHMVEKAPVNSIDKKQPLPATTPLPNRDLAREGRISQPINEPQHRKDLDG